MSKKTENAAPVTEKPVAVLSEAITASVALETVERDAEGAAVDVLVITLAKGKLDGQKAYQASGGGKTGLVAKGMKAAIANLLEKHLKVLPAAWVIPNADKDVNFPVVGGNEPKEPENFDELSPEDQAAMSENLSDIAHEFAEYRVAAVRTREATFALSRKVRDLRTSYSKAEWRIFAALARKEAADAKDAVSEALADFLDEGKNKNALGEFVFLGGLPGELLALLPEGKNSPKAVQAWVNGLRSEGAEKIVGYVKRSDELAALPFHEAVMATLQDDDFILSVKAEDVLVNLHWENIKGCGALFGADAAGDVIPNKVKDENGKLQHVTRSLFGTEGADELVKALCSALNGYRTAAEVEADKEAKAKAKPLASRDFNTLPVGDVALHLFRILAGRINEDGDAELEATCADCTAIVAALGDMVNAVATGEKTIADILKPAEDAPETEDEAEADADAAA